MIRQHPFPFHSTCPILITRSVPKGRLKFGRHWKDPPPASDLLSVEEMVYEVLRPPSSQSESYCSKRDAEREGQNQGFPCDTSFASTKTTQKIEFLYNMWRLRAASGFCRDA